MANRDHERERRDHENQHGDKQPRDADERQDGLTLIRHQVDLTQRMREPDDRRQADQNQQKRAERGTENVAVKRTHWLAASPISPATYVPDAPQPRS